jgi:hypothetical protein
VPKREEGKGRYTTLMNVQEITSSSVMERREEKVLGCSLPFITLGAKSSILVCFESWLGRKRPDVIKVAVSNFFCLN